MILAILVPMKVLFLSLLVVLMPEVAWAGGGAGHEPHISDLMWFWFNFLVYCSILFFLLRKPAASFWQSRAEAIESKINSAEKALGEAEERLRTAREKMSSLDQSIKELEAKVQSETEQEISALATDTTDQLERIKRQLEMAIQSERQAVFSELQQELTSKVVSNTEQELVKYFSEEKDADYRSAALDGLAAISAGIR